MRRAALVTGVVALLALGAVAGWFAARETEDPERIVETSTVTVTTTEEAPDAALPEAVARTRQALLEADSAEARLRDLDHLLDRELSLLDKRLAPFQADRRTLLTSVN